MSRARGVKATVSTNYNAVKVKEKFDKLLLDFTNRVTTQLQNSIKRTLSKKGKGKKYSGLNYRSAAPGDPPTVQSGTLRRSWVTQAARTQPKKRPNSVSLSLGSNVIYARALDKWGSSYLGMSKGHPYIAPAIGAPRFRAGIKREIKRFGKKAKQTIRGSTKARRIIR